MEITKDIFRNYDIRGIYPTELDEKVSYKIGQAFGTFFIKRNLHRIVVGRDDRKSSTSLSESFIKGLLSTGCHVTYIGITLTPVIHFLTCGKDFDAGVNITASHNPKEYNGFRPDYSGAVPFFGEDIQKLYNMILKDDFVSGSGKYSEESLSQKYTDYIAAHFSLGKGIKVAINCGNGASSIIAPQVFNSIGADISTLECRFDGDFTHGVPDPERQEFLLQLKKTVLDSKADVGFGFDTDGDRVGMLDELGNTYTADQLLMLLASDLLPKKRGGTVIFDVKSTEALVPFIKQCGGVPKMVRTGHPYFLREMRNGAVLGAEFAGHVYCGDSYFGYDDGIYAACRVLEIMDKSDKKLSELMKQIPKRVSSGELKVSCSEARKSKVLAGILSSAKENSKIVKTITIDGLRAYVSETGWFLIRASNTTPFLTVRLEGIDEKEMALVRKEAESLLSKFNLKW